MIRCPRSRKIFFASAVNFLKTNGQSMTPRAWMFLRKQVVVLGRGKPFIAEEVYRRVMPLKIGGRSDLRLLGEGNNSIEFI